MDLQPAIRTFDFSPQLDQAEIENRCARESFTWGPQAVWLLCGLIWLFYLLVRDIPELAWNAMLFGMGATLLAALAAWYEIRRRKRQVVLCLCGAASVVIEGIVSNTASHRKKWYGCRKIFLVGS
jgi:hypothetical protein